jgi:hypothetical protein
MNMVWQDRASSAPDLYVGGMEAAADIDYLTKHGVGSVLNCSINADINYVDVPYDADAPDDLKRYGYGPIRYYKLGLVDGPGNPPEMLLAGYYLLCGIIGQQMPERPSYPNRDRGHVLVNCRAGRSRSIILVSLYLRLQHAGQFPNLADALSFVRAAREIRPDEFHEAPNRDLVEAAEWAVTAVNRLNCAAG